MRRVYELLGAFSVLAAPISALQAEEIVGLTSDQRIVTFDTASPGTIVTSAAITGLSGGDVLTGIDLRPANSLIYGVAASSGRIYTLTTSGVATLISTVSTVPTGGAFGIDFNPVPDRLRLISNTDQNLRINVDTGAATVDTGITRSGGGAIDIVGSAYTNSVPGQPAPATTQLFGIDAATDSLLFSAAPNGGVYTSVGALGVSVSEASLVGFDISGRTGAAFLSIDSSLYSVNLATGAVTFLNRIGGGPLIGLTATGAVPEPTTWAFMISGFGLAGLAMRRHKILSAIA
jgi:hypothetical protein